MKRTCLNICPPKVQVCALLLLLTGLYGCAVQGMINSAERAAGNGRYNDAVVYYQRALREKPSLKNDASFMARYRDVQVSAQLAKAAEAYRAKQFEPAVKYLRKAVELDPQHVAAGKFLNEALEAAAGDLYRRTIESANAGKLGSAIGLAKRALEYDSEHKNARAALASVDPKRAKENPTKADELYAKSEQLLKEKQWFKAVEGFESALKVDPAHLPSRVATHQALESLKQSQTLFNKGKKLIQTRQLDEAIEQFEQALDVWPNNDEAIEWLVDTQNERKRAQQLFDQAVTAAKTQQWEKAITAVDRCVDIYPFYPDAGTFRKQTRIDAASFYVLAGREQLKGGKLDDAETTFQKAFRYTRDFGPAVAGLADINVEQARQAQAAGQHGRAMLWFRMARERVPEPKYEKLFEESRRTVQDQVKFAVHLEQVDAQDDPRSYAFRQSLKAQLNRKKPRFIDVRDSTKAANKAPAVLYVLRTVVDSLDVDMQKTRSESGYHSYTTYQRMRNPRVNQLRYEIDLAHKDLRTLQHYLLHSHSICRIHAHRHHDRSIVRHGWQSSACSAAHRMHYRVHQQRNLIARLERQLRSEPAEVNQPIRTGWPYQPEHFEKVATPSATVSVASISGKDLDAIPLTRRSVYRDRIIHNANPQIGLNEDPLTIPDDPKARGELIDEAAKEGVTRALSKILETRAMALNRQARAAEEEGQFEKAFELNVKAAIVLQPVDPNQAVHIIEQLAEQLK